MVPAANVYWVKQKVNLEHGFFSLLVFLVIFFMFYFGRGGQP